MENTNKAPRITKAMKHNDIIAMLSGEAPQHITREEAIKFCQDEIALLMKKNSSEGKKPTAQQEADSRYMDLIVEWLSMQETPKTCTEIGKGVEALNDFQNQKIASLMKKLADAHRVVKSKGKNDRSLFAVA